MEIIYNQEITFGKYKGVIPSQVGNMHKNDLKQFCKYIVWAIKDTDIEIIKENFYPLFTMLSKLTRPTEVKIDNTHSRVQYDNEPFLWGNECLPGEMSSWF